MASLRIELVHKVPPQHKVEATGAHATTNEEKNLFRKYGPLRKGLYSPTEDKIITQNWNSFCKVFFYYITIQVVLLIWDVTHDLKQSI